MQNAKIVSGYRRESADSVVREMQGAQSYAERHRRGDAPPGRPARNSDLLSQAVGDCERSRAGDRLCCGSSGIRRATRGSRRRMLPGAVGADAVRVTTAKAVGAVCVACFRSCDSQRWVQIMLWLWLRLRLPIHRSLAGALAINTTSAGG